MFEENISQNQPERDFKGIWIPKEVWLDKRLTPKAKLLYGTIVFLSDKSGNCYATNNQLNVFFGVSKRSISQWIQQLVECRYIHYEIRYKPDSKEIEARILKILI